MPTASIAFASSSDPGTRQSLLLGPPPFDGDADQLPPSTMRCISIPGTSWNHPSRCGRCVGGDRERQGPAGGNSRTVGLGVTLSVLREDKRGRCYSLLYYATTGGLMASGSSGCQHRFPRTLHNPADGTRACGGTSAQSNPLQDRAASVSFPRAPIGQEGTRVRAYPVSIGPSYFTPRPAQPRQSLW